jgi:hypothetical protein
MKKVKKIKTNSIKGFAVCICLLLLALPLSLSPHFHYRLCSGGGVVGAQCAAEQCANRKSVFLFLSLLLNDLVHGRH